MWSFPLFPEAASSHAGDVDAVYFMNLGVMVFFLALVFAFDEMCCTSRSPELTR